MTRPGSSGEAQGARSQRVSGTWCHPSVLPQKKFTPIKVRFTHLPESSTFVTDRDSLTSKMLYCQQQEIAYFARKCHAVWEDVSVAGWLSRPAFYLTIHGLLSSHLCCVKTVIALCCYDLFFTDHVLFH